MQRVMARLPMQDLDGKRLQAVSPPREAPGAGPSHTDAPLLLLRQVEDLVSAGKDGVLPEDGAPQASPGPEPSLFRVLVSSKDPCVSRLLQERLTRGEGFEVLSPPPDWGVVEAVVDQSPHLLVLDIDWKTGAPVEVVRLLKKVRPALRIVALSAESCPRDGEVVSEGVLYYTVKPVGADLFEVIQAATRSDWRPGGESRQAGIPAARERRIPRTS